MTGAQRLLAPGSISLVALLVVALTYEQSRDVSSTVAFLTAFLTTAGIYAIFTIALNVQWGYTGVFNFGVAAFFMVGAYTAAIFTKTPAQGELVRYVGGYGDVLSPPFLDADQWLPFLVGAAAAAIACGLLAFLLSIPTLQLREDYLAIATIGVAELLRRVTIQEQGLVNGTRGLPGIPRPLHDYVDPSDYKYVYLAIVAVTLVLVFFVVERSVRTPWGRVLRALKEDETATAASGKNVFLFKMQGFIFGAMIMGVGGAVFAYSRGAVGPDTFEHFFATFIFWAMLIVGGSGNNRGAIAGAFVIWGIWTITQLLASYDLPDVLRTRIFFIREFLVGALIVVFVLLMPRGLIPEGRRVSVWLEREVRDARRREAPPPEEAPEA
jgi:branched-chain amino acid transport system permease protein